MKKYIILAAISAITVVSCTKQAVTPVVSEQEEISFQSCIVGESTKGTDAYTDSMKVTAFFTTGQAKYFDNRDFSFSTVSSSYLATPAAYWPVDPADGTTGLPLDFYAISSTSGDYTITSSTTSTQNDTKTIVVGTSAPVSGSDDIVAGTLLNKAKGDAGMVMNLNHLLTRIAFQAIGADNQYKYVVSSVTVKALSTGTYTFGTNGWSNVATSKADYAYTLADPVNGVTLAYNHSAYVSLGTSDNELLLLPGQAATAGTVTVTIAYKVYQNVSGTDTEIFDGSNTFDISAGANADWGVNKSIIYKFTLPN